MKDRDVIRQAKAADQYRRPRTDALIPPRDDLSPAAKRAYLRRRAAAVALANEAQAALLQRHAGMIHRIAFRFAGKSGVPAADLVQAGRMGLIHAIRLFTEDLGFEFMTYAAKAIFTFVARECHEHRTIRVPLRTRHPGDAEQARRVVSLHLLLSYDDANGRP